MWDWSWIETSWSDALMALVSLSVVYLGIVAYTRIAGLRSFSKMAASDFAMTVAVGSLFGTAIASPSPPLALTAVVLAGLFAGQWLFAVVRRRSQSASDVLDNSPLLLMEGPRILETNLDQAHVTRQDLIAKLREANVLDFSQVRAVVFETTGDISVLHGDADGPALEPALLEGVRR